MSLIPRNSSNNNSSSSSSSNNSVVPWSTYPQQLWDSFFPSPFPFLLTPFSGQTASYSQLAVETSGNVSAKFECLEVESAHLIVGDLPGFGRHQVNVEVEDGVFLRVSGQGENSFSWRVRMPGDASLQMITWSLENGVLTVVVPKVGVQYFMGGGFDCGNSQRVNVRQIDIEGSDD